MQEKEFEDILQTFVHAALFNIFYIRNHKQNDSQNGINSSGDKVSKLDLDCNQAFIDQLSFSSWCAGVTSEELDKPLFFNNGGKYVVVLDPLDGSSNIEVDNPVGSIFGVYPIKGDFVCEDDFLQPAPNLVLAGYILYCVKPIMVVACNNEVSEFEIQQSFIISDNSISCPEQGKTVAINSGNYPGWDKLTKDWFDTTVEYGKSSFRYSGCMVADFHRVLLQGGIFAYPADRKNKNGKLRLLFECAPLAFIMHMAGGTSTTGASKDKSILDIVPTSLHQTTPIFIGSKQNIADYFKG